MIFHRPEYARALAKRLLEPSVLDEALRSGVFLHGARGTGKTTFVLQDFIPAVRELGAQALYVDLSEERARAPMPSIYAAVQVAATELEDRDSKRLGSSSGVQQTAFSARSGDTLSDAFVDLVRKAQGNVVLVIDEVQQALATEDGRTMLFALKAARDMVNISSDMPGRLLIVGMGSPPSVIKGLATHSSQAFMGAYTAAFEPLDQGDVIAERSSDANLSPNGRRHR